jgi:hypothetical protein
VSDDRSCFETWAARWHLRSPLQALPAESGYEYEADRPAYRAGERRCSPAGWTTTAPSGHQVLRLSPKQLREAAIPPSTLSLLGLVRHLVDVEHSWFRRTIGGEAAPPIYYSEEQPTGRSRSTMLTSPRPSTGGPRNASGRARSAQRPPHWTRWDGTVNLVVCLVAGRIAGLLAVRWEGLGWWGSRCRRTGGFAIRQRSSAIACGCITASRSVSARSRR